MHTLQSGNLLVTLTAQGNFSLSVKQAPESALQLQLLPLRHEIETQFPYQTTLLKPVSATQGQSAAAQLPQVYWSVNQTDTKLELSCQVNQWQYSQHISLENNRCRIETFLHVNESQPLPTSLELFYSDLPGVWNDSRMLVLRGSMGHNKIKAQRQTSANEHAISPWVLQTDQHAVSLYSDSGSPHPLKWVRSNSGWHGAVMLAPEMTPGVHSLGYLNIELGSCGQELLESYAKRFAAPKPLKPSPKCWNSWDYFHSSISHKNILESTQALASDPFMKEHIDTIVLDMGWEIRHGEWVADSYFPKGMKAMADDIRAAGFQAGLWFAPIIIDPECNTFQDNYDFVGKNRFGFPDRTYECCGLFGYILDVTNPEGEEYLRSVFKEFREMGYTYFKLDFLRYMMYVGRYQNGRMTNLQVMQRALQIIREAVGDDAYILGCNLPLDVGAGYCDATRMTSDVAVFWNSIRENASSLCMTYFFNQQWWENDPDFLVVRGRDTFESSKPIYQTWWFPRQDQFNEEHLQRFTERLSRDGTISLEEARVHASLVMISGGSQVLGDPYAELNEKGRQLLKKVLAAPTAPGKPVSIFKGDLPASIWIQKLPEFTRVGLFNWNDIPSQIRLQETALGISIHDASAKDFWSEETLSLTEGMAFDLAPRTCRILEIKHS